MNKNLLKIICSALAVLAACAAAGLSQEKKESDAAHKIVHFADLKWTGVLKGCDLAPVSGDLNAEGAPFVIRIRHPTDESITVMKGTFLVGMGETFDESKLLTMNFGNFMVMPKEMRHFALCKGEVIVQVHRLGPFKNNWVNPSEVPPPDAAATAKP
jgi:hypothetical protein